MGVLYYMCPRCHKRLDMQTKKTDDGYFIRKGKCINCDFMLAVSNDSLAVCKEIFDDEIKRARKGYPAYDELPKCPLCNRKLDVKTSISKEDGYYHTIGKCRHCDKGWASIAAYDLVCYHDFCDYMNALRKD